MKIIYCIGIDGAGKTTLARNLVRWLNHRQVKAKYFYGQHIPVLLRPAKIIAKHFIFRKENEFEGYEKYYSKKTTLTRKYRWLGWSYAFLWLMDYIIITWIRLLPKAISCDYLVVDRFFIDVIVNISDTLKLNNTQMLNLLNKISYFFPKPDHIIYININPQVAFQRKNDIQALSYLERRVKRYNFLSEKIHFMEIDGELSQDDLLRNLLACLKLVSRKSDVEILSAF